SYGSPGRGGAGAKEHRGVERLSYDHADYAFGQAMLTLRTTIGLTQARLAEYLGASRRAAVTWGSGSRFPSAQHLKKYIARAGQQQAFPAGRENDAIRALWRGAHQKMLLDEVWLAALLGQAPAALRAASAPLVAQTVAIPPTPEPAVGGPRLDWGD